MRRGPAVRPRQGADRVQGRLAQRRALLGLGTQQPWPGRRCEGDGQQQLGVVIQAARFPGARPGKIKDELAPRVTL